MSESGSVAPGQASSRSKYEVFISYRRDTGSDAAGRIQEALIRRGHSTFLDTTDVKEGYYNKILLECIEATPNFIILLSCSALDRCTDEADVLRTEIVHAVRNRRNIIPIMVPGFKPPDAEMPAEITDILQLQALHYEHIYFPALIDQLLILLVDAAGGARPNPGAAAGPRDSLKRRRLVIHSLAVLPFEDLASCPETAYLSDGITENIINILSQLPNMRVMARGTVFRFRDAVGDPQRAGRALQVDTVLTGRILLRDRMFVVAAELIDVTDGSQIWGRRYTKQPSTMFDIERQLARDIARELRPRLAPKKRRQLLRQYTEDTRAYELYLKGRYHWNQRTAEGLRKGIQCFEHAIERDDNYALAYAGLGDSFALLGGYRILAPQDAFPRAKDAAAKALHIDPDLAEAHAALALARLYFDWDWTKAEKEFKRAIRLSPNYPTARQWYANYLMAVGRSTEALQSMEHAHALDPLSLIINTQLGWVLYFVRRFDEAVEQLTKAIELDPDYVLAHFVSGQSYARLSQYGDAVAELERAASLSGRLPVVLSGLAHTYGLMGERAEARKLLRELELAATTRFVSAYDVALIHLGLGEVDIVIQWLRKAFTERSSWMVFLKAEPVFDTVRDDRRFQEIVRAVGLP